MTANPNTQSGGPEWIRVKQATVTFGIGRSTLYRWIEEKRLRSVAVRDDGAKMGTRLIHADSLRKLIESFEVTA